MKEHIKNLMGPLPKERAFIQRMRRHQAWWRAFVLQEEPGKHPSRTMEKIGSTILQGKTSGKNFLTENTLKAVRQTMEERKTHTAGLIAEDRLYNNLLSSQPLCFNFFGELKMDHKLALQVLQCFYPDLTRVNRVLFEFASAENDTQDNSAFDVAFEVERGSARGLVGLECKYTETFSTTVYDKPAYREIFTASDMFSASYETLSSGRYNQLFRNQLMAAALVKRSAYDFVHTGLFCHPEDTKAMETGKTFAGMLAENGLFQVITYRDFLERVQQSELDWALREWTMLLWARYCGVSLSGD